MKNRLFYIIILYVLFIDGGVVVEGVRNVKIGEYPYMAYIYYPHESKLKLEYRRFMDAAVLITPDFLLSSEIDLEYNGAFPANTLLARLGTVKIEPNIGPVDENEQEREIFELIKPLGSWWKREMNMMRTAIPFEVNLIVNPTPIITRKMDLEQRTCHVLIFSQFENGGDDKILMRLDVMMLVSDVETCGKKFDERTMTCGRYKEENITSVIDVDFCQDNAGGPLICDGEVMGLQAYFDSDDCKSPYLYQMFWAWDSFITCGTKACVGDCNKICISKFRETTDDNVYDSIILGSTDGSGRRGSLGGEHKSIGFSKGQEPENVRKFRIYHTQENENTTYEGDSVPLSNSNNTLTKAMLSTQDNSTSLNTKNEDKDLVDRFIQSREFENIPNLDITFVDKAKTKSDHEQDHREINSYIIQTEKRTAKAILKGESNKKHSWHTNNNLQEQGESNETEIYVPLRTNENMQINDNGTLKEINGLGAENIYSNGNNASKEIRNKIEDDVYRKEKKLDVIQNVKHISKEDTGNNQAFFQVKTETTSEIGNTEKEIDKSENGHVISKDDGRNGLDKIKATPNDTNLSENKKGSAEEDNDSNASEQIKNEIKSDNIGKEMDVLENEKESPTLYNYSIHRETVGEDVKKLDLTENKIGSAKEYNDNNVFDQITNGVERSSTIVKEGNALENEMKSSKEETDESDADETKDKSEGEVTVKESEDTVNKINSENEENTSRTSIDESEREKEISQGNDNTIASNNRYEKSESEIDSIGKETNSFEAVQEVPIGESKNETLDETENDNVEIGNQTDVSKNKEESSRDENDYNDLETSKYKTKKVKSSSKLNNSDENSGSEFTESYESNSSNIIIEVTNVVIKTVEDLLNVHKNHASRTTIDLNETLITPKPKMAKMGRAMTDHAGTRTHHKLFSFLFAGTLFDVVFVTFF